MCQLLGLSSNRPIDIQLSLKEFQKRGKENPHGFGFAFYMINKGWSIYKKPQSLANQNIEEKEFKHRSKTIIGHVRLASCGNLSHVNTHPFKRSQWVFAHNGTVSKICSLPSFILNKYRPEGQTDSEYAFCYLLEKLNGIKKIDEMVKIVSQEAEQIKKYGRFNFLLSDGIYLFAYGHDRLFFVTRKYPFGEVILKETHYTIHLKDIKHPDEIAVIIATEPITKNENWKQLSGLKIFRNGEEVSNV